MEGSATEDEPGSEAFSSEGYERDSLMGGLSSSGDDQEQDEFDVECTNASEDEESSGTGAALQRNACLHT